MAAEKIPQLLQHMTLAIYESDWGSGSREQRFFHAFRAAVGNLVKNGYLEKTSLHAPASGVVLTTKGKQREVDHRREAGAAVKSRRFEMLYVLVEAVLEQPVEGMAEGGTYPQRMQLRRAEAAQASPPPQARRPTKAKPKKAFAKKVSRVQRAVRRS